LAWLARVLLAGWLGWPGAVLSAPVIRVLLSEPAGVYQETAASLLQALSREDWNISVSSPEAVAANGVNLTVAIGTRALETALAQPGRPVLSLLVPRLTYERLAAGQRQISALYLDQPLPRQLQLLELALPGLKRAGVPLGPTSQGLQPALADASKDSGLPVDTALIQRSADLYAALTSLAETSQAFLLLPDPVVTQRGVLQNFFLHTYRLKKPVLAYSAPLVQSGALLGLYATPAQLGEEAAGWMRESWIKGEFRLGASRYPKRFTIGVNRSVARSLEIALPDEGMLSRQLEAMP
jgi:ABC-type uncharacterized transport system substrate-binding protein